MQFVTQTLAKLYYGSSFSHSVDNHEAFNGNVFFLSFSKNISVWLNDDSLMRNFSLVNNLLIFWGKIFFLLIMCTSFVLVSTIILKLQRILQVLSQFVIGYDTK